MNAFDQYEVWFVTGAQLLYGGDAVIAVDAHSNEMVNGLNESGKLPVKVVYKGTANSSKEVEAVFKAANNDDKCVGVITWMHTFSPAKMWIHGLQQLKKPLLHLHTQFNKEIPWDTMDMDFMNLNQSARGDREFGHIVTRMRKNRKVVVGHWQDEKAQNQIAAWMRVAAAWADAQDMLIIRFGDQMNNVAVTDGDKVSAEQVLGYHVDYYPINDVMTRNAYFEKTQRCGESVADFMKAANYISREHTRTPMHWDDTANAGFTTGTPWIPLNPNYPQINAAKQVGDPDSVYTFYRRLLALRKSDKTFVYGHYALLLPDDEEIYAYTRTLNDEQILVVCNFTDHDVPCPLLNDWQNTELLISNYNTPRNPGSLRPFEAVVYRK